MFLLLRALKGARHWFLISRQEPDDVILWLNYLNLGMTALQSWNLTTLPISGRNLLDLNLAFLLIKVVSLCSSEPHPLCLLFLHCFVVRLLFTGENRGSIHLCHSVGGISTGELDLCPREQRAAWKRKIYPVRALRQDIQNMLVSSFFHSHERCATWICPPHSDDRFYCNIPRRQK